MRFAGDMPIQLDEVDPAAGNILDLNTLGGPLRHRMDACSDAMTGPGGGVTSIATDRSVTKLAAMAGISRQRFGEPPRATPGRAHRRGWRTA